MRLDVTIGNTRQVEAAVVEGRSDIGLVEGRVDNPALVRDLVDHDRLVLVVARQAALPPERAPGRPDLPFRVVGRARGGIGHARRA